MVTSPPPSRPLCWMGTLALLGLLTALGCSETSDDIFQQGEELRKKGDREKAVASYTKALKMLEETEVSEDEVQAKADKKQIYSYARGVAYHKLGKLEKAYQDYTNAFPKNHKAYAGRARVWLTMDAESRSKKEWDAAHDFTIAINMVEEEGEECAEYYYFLGKALEQTGKDAQWTFDKAQELGYEPEEEAGSDTPDQPADDAPEDDTSDDDIPSDELPDEPVDNEPSPTTDS